MIDNDILQLSALSASMRTVIQDLAAGRGTHFGVSGFLANGHRKTVLVALSDRGLFDMTTKTLTAKGQEVARALDADVQNNQHNTGAHTMAASNWVHLDVSEIKGESDLAFLVELEDGEELWLPKSQISDPQDYNRGDRNVTLSITEWLARQKGLDS
jgi:hypothetical protein